MAVLGLVLSLSGCTHWPGFSQEAQPVLMNLPAKFIDFRLEGRVSVKAGEESFSGGMRWHRETLKEELLLRTPLGQGVAEIRKAAVGMELTNSEGRIYRAPDIDTLVKQAIGLELPLRGLAWWVVGMPRPNVEYRAKPDSDGHLGELHQDGWQIFFSRYEEHAGQWLPGKLLARRGEELDVRLVVDAWELP